MGLPNRADHLDRVIGTVDHRSCMARAGNVRNWNSHRVDRCADVLPMAAARRTTCQSSLALAREIFMYACKIKETANGSRRSACSKTQQEVQVLAQRRISPNGKNEAQREAYPQAQEEVELT